MYSVKCSIKTKRRFVALIYGVVRAAAQYPRVTDYRRFVSPGACAKVSMSKNPCPLPFKDGLKAEVRFHCTSFE